MTIKQFQEDFCTSSFSFQTFIIITITIILLSIVIFILIALSMRHSMEKKRFLQTNKLDHWWINEDDLKKDKIYDIFLSFCHKDENFVLKELVPKIEGREKPYKLCIHSRDWMAGEWIHNNIMKSVSESKCTLILFSENFLKSLWGMMELRIANNQMLMAKQTKVILILYGEIKNFENLDFEVKSYLRINSNIKWSDPQFWKKLFTALPDPLP